MVIHGEYMAGALCSYPHVIAKLKQIWGNYQAIEEYVDKLAMNDREQRLGFSKEAWTELQFIVKIHKDVFGK